MKGKIVKSRKHQQNHMVVYGITEDGMAMCCWDNGEGLVCKNYDPQQLVVLATGLDYLTARLKEENKA